MTIPRNLAKEICTVQPMSGPNGLVFYFHYKYNMPWYKKIFTKYFWQKIINYVKCQGFNIHTPCFPPLRFCSICRKTLSPTHKLAKLSIPQEETWAGQ